MGKMTFQDCLNKGKLVVRKLDPSAIDAELAAAEYDIQKAEKDFEEGDFKWATVKAYYSAFHSARALLFWKGYSEKSHRCLLAFLEAFFPQLSHEFSTLLMLRETADYDSNYSEATARKAIELSGAIIDKTKEILVNL